MPETKRPPEPKQILHFIHDFAWQNRAACSDQITESVTTFRVRFDDASGKDYPNTGAGYQAALNDIQDHSLRCRLVDRMLDFVKAGIRLYLDVSSPVIPSIKGFAVTTSVSSSCMSNEFITEFICRDPFPRTLVFHPYTQDDVEAVLDELNLELQRFSCQTAPNDQANLGNGFHQRKTVPC